MSWFDAGVNLLDPRFELDAVLQSAWQADVKQVCVISSNLQESQQAVDLVSRYRREINTPEACELYCTAGVHPHHADGFCADGFKERDANKLAQLLQQDEVVAVGECGLDFNRNFSTQANQLRAFELQLELAQDTTKPLYLHERDAFAAQIALLKRYISDKTQAIAHCFTGTQAQLEAYLQLGCYIGITGWVCDDTRGQDLQQAVASMPLERLILETDAPYLFPKNVRPRARTNEPKYLPFVAQKVAELMQLPLSEVQAASTTNAARLFGLANA